MKLRVHSFSIHDITVFFHQPDKQLEIASSSGSEFMVMWKLFHFHWVQILSCLKRFLYILLCFSPSCHKLANPIPPLITELIIWIHHEIWIPSGSPLLSQFQPHTELTIQDVVVLKRKSNLSFITFEYRACSLRKIQKKYNHNRIRTFISCFYYENVMIHKLWFINYDSEEL